MINLPIFRAKKLDSDEYIIGQYIETEFSNEEYCDIEEQETIIKHCIIKDFRTVHDDYEYCNFDITEIDISTLSIHFPDMLDSQGNKIFASLSEDGKGGDICDLYLFKNQDKPTRENYTCRYKNQKIMFKNFNFENYAKIEIIGIQE
ncbi:hypothetical protein [Aliarcobacter butzleri]|uniref:hypothetical protein n=1 Tax=Aliarcobacter butzleri TaxID=28197 RepID=UPI0012F8BCB9|nr:hypothetical protein [Aliarcobacter butzleri]